MLVEASFEAIIGLRADGVIRSWNRGAANTYGYSATEAIGRSDHFSSGRAITAASSIA